MERREQFGLDLQKCREKAGMSLRQLGEAIGVSQETIRQYELGRIPDADKLTRLSDALNTREFVLDDFEISIARRGTRPQQIKGEQLSFDFTAEYTSSTAKIQIRPGSVSITLIGRRADRAS